MTRLPLAEGEHLPVPALQLGRLLWDPQLLATLRFLACKTCSLFRRGDAMYQEPVSYDFWYV